MKMKPTVIVGRDKICQEYGFGRRTLEKLVEKKAPISRIGKNYICNTEAFDDFVKTLAMP